MPKPLIKATVLRSPAGTEFVAFFDVDRRIPNRESAMAFLHAVGLLITVPMTVTFREGEQWLNLGSTDDCARFMGSLDEDQRASLQLSDPVVTIPGTPQQPGRTDK